MARLTTALLLTAAIPMAGLASAANAQTNTSDQSGTPTEAGIGQSTASSTNAPAEPVPSAGTGRRDDAGDIVVTARRVEERLQDVPISITVFNQAQLNQRNIVTANDLTTYTPSLTSQSRFGDETASFAIRGFVQEGFTSPSVAVYFADVIAPRAQGGTSGGNGAGVGAFFDLQNVQVLKGPQGTLFGRNTSGGAILLVPQKPTSQFGGYVEGSLGNYDMRRIQAVLNVPVSDTVRFRVGVDRQVRDGFVHNFSGIGPKRFQNIDYVSVRASLVIDITPEIENYTIATYSKSDTNGTVPRLVYSATTTSAAGVPCQPAAQGLPGLLGPLACAQILRQAARGDGYYGIENNNPDAHLNIEQWQAINTTTYAATDTLTIKNIASYQEFRQGTSTAIFGENFSFFGQPLGYVSLYQDQGRNNIQQWTVTEELQIQGHTPDNKLTYQGGAYYERSGPIDGYQGSRASIFASCTDVLALQCNSGPLGFGFVNNSLTKYRFRNIGLYAQATYKLSDKLSVTGGIRYTIDRTRGVGATRVFTFPTPNTPVAVCPNAPPPAGPSPALVAADPNACAQSFSTKSEKPTWLIDLDYKPSEYVLLYAKYARGYRQGGLNVSNTVPNAWGPERVDNYEVGAKTSFRGAVPGSFNFAAFYADFNNQQLQANLIPCTQASPPLTTTCPGGVNPLASSAATIINGGKSRIQGIEADTQINPFAGLRLSAGYAYLDTKLKSLTSVIIPGYIPVIPTSVPGGRLILSPRHKLTMTAAYTLPLDQSVGDVSFGATYTYTSNQVAAADSAVGILPATNLLNLNANWNGIAGRPVDLALFVTNLTKEKYPVFVGGTTASAGFDSLILGQPRMYGVRLRVRFGN